MNSLETRKEWLLASDESPFFPRVLSQKKGPTTFGMMRKSHSKATRFHEDFGLVVARAAFFSDSSLGA